MATDIRRARKDEMLMVEHRRLARLVVEYAESLGGVPVISGPCGQFFDGHDVETAAGRMRIHYSHAWRGFVHCRFDEPERASLIFYGEPRHPLAAMQGRLNPYSGKFNFHFGPVDAHDAMDWVRHELSAFLLCPLKPREG